MFYTLANGNSEKISYIFPKESFSYISGNGTETPKGIPYISGNGTFELKIMKKNKTKQKTLDTYP